MKKYLVLMVSIVAFSCATMKISSDYDRQADFAKFKTYQLSYGTQNLQIQQLNRDRIIAAVEKELAAKGFTKSDNADLIVDVNIAGKEVQTATATTNGGYGYRGWRYGGGYTTTQINYDQHIEGSMVITLVDSSTKNIVWQGTGTKTLLENVSAEKREKNINYAVQQILKNYPPN